MQHQGPEANENNDDEDRGGGGGSVDWPACENVLRSLCEDVRPTGAAVARDDERVAADVRSCLAERVAPVARRAATGPAGGPLRSRPRWRPSAGPDDAAVVAAAGRTQTRAMAVRSAYADGKYYASDVPHASRTVEELSLWRRWPAADVNRNTYTAGTVLYDRGTGTCHLHGLADPRRRVAVDCGRLTVRLPRHGSTVKMFSELRAPDDDGAPVLVPHHFQVFRLPPRRRDISPAT